MPVAGGVAVALAQVFLAVTKLAGPELEHLELELEDYHQKDSQALLALVQIMQCTLTLIRHAGQHFSLNLIMIRE